MEAVNPSLIDCGTERVTTSRRPKRVSRKKRSPTSRQFRGQSASQSLRYRPASPHQHRAANARADDKRQVGINAISSEPTTKTRMVPVVAAPLSIRRRQRPG